LKKLGAIIIAGMLFLLIALRATSFAQSFGGLSQLFGGGGSGHSKNSSPSDAAVTVQRNAAPYIGKFDGTQKDSNEADLDARFACYPAHDSAFPQNQAYLCYTAVTSSGGAD
jgi:hypothetical protein